MESFILEISYLVASILYILGLKMLSHPDSARKGNLWAAFGMGLAIFATIFFYEQEGGAGLDNKIWIFAAIAVGTIGGWMAAVKVQMTAMPQMVSLFNGMGGACAALISLMEYKHLEQGHMMSGEALTVVLGLLIGSVSFSGSMVAFGKLDGRINDIRSNALRYFNMVLLVGLFACGGYIMMQSGPSDTLLYVLFGLSLLYGILFVMPIGGADMPVVISLLNSFTGVAAACGGFLYGNQAMLTGGILVGSAGTILTILMCQAMNRPLSGVIFGAFGGGGEAADGGPQGNIKEISISDAAVLLAYSQKVSIVPGYGLAVAQAQHVCHELEKHLEDKGVEVSYAIHPVAGRMPGHMNVLLAEADVAYPKLKEMEDVNPEMSSTDVVIVIGANDVVNPAAETDPSSPIFGMPIIKVLDAKNVIVMKRSMGKGYAGIENELFFADKNRMLFGDAKDSLTALATEVKSM